MTTSTTSEPGSPRSRDAVAEAFEELRSRILEGKLAPGTELSQVQLARELGVSTTPLREALRRLEAEDLVEARRNRRPRVPLFDVADVDSVYCGRVLIESVGISLAVPAMQPEDIEGLRARLREMDELQREGDRSAWAARHAAFHMALVNGCSEPMLRQIASLMARSDRYRRMSVAAPGGHAGRADGGAEHIAIVDACAAGDARGAAFLLAQHLTRSALVVVAHFAPDADPVGVRRALQMIMGWAADADRPLPRRGR